MTLFGRFRRGLTAWLISPAEMRMTGTLVPHLSQSGDTSHPSGSGP